MPAMLFRIPENLHAGAPPPTSDGGMNTIFASILPWFLGLSLTGSAAAPAPAAQDPCCPCCIVCTPDCCDEPCCDNCCPAGCCEAEAKAPAAKPAAPTGCCGSSCGSGCGN